jgi:hypothetical protein
MRSQVSWQLLVFGVVALVGGILLGSRWQTSDPVQSSAADRLQPVSTGSATSAPGATVYVPIYSSLYLGLNIKNATVELSATLSVRNVSSVHPIVIDWVRYYGSKGNKIRDYVDKPSELPPLSSVEFVVQRSDATGGPGANFLIHWSGPANVDQPIIEAVMVGQSGSAGISFTSAGRVVRSETGPR